MFSVTILKMKDIKKYGMLLLAIILIMIIVKKGIPSIIEHKRVMQNLVLRDARLESLEQAVPTIASINEEEQTEETKKEVTKGSLLQGFLKTQVSSIEGLEKAEEKLNLANEKEKEETRRRRKFKSGRTCSGQV